MKAIKTEHLTKRYKSLTAVDRLDLSVEEGELFGLLGVNGAGKTTTVKMLTGLIQPTDGDAFILGKSIVKQAADVKKIIGVSPQETAVAPNLTVKENLQFICGIYGFSKKKTEERTEAMVKAFHLEKNLSKKAGKLSGGYQRRLSIAMALISEPKLLFLDEPTLGLDVLARSELWEIIRKLKGKITVILTTHYMEEAEALCDRIAVMKEGIVIACDRPERLLEKTNSTRMEEAFIKIVRGESI